MFQETLPDLTVKTELQYSYDKNTLELLPVKQVVTFILSDTEAEVGLFFAAIKYAKIYLLSCGQLKKTFDGQVVKGYLYGGKR